MAFNLEQVKSLFSSLREKSAEVANAAADKTKDAARLAKLTMDIGTEKANLEKAYLELGKAFYEESKDTAQGLIAQLCAEVAAVAGRIDDMQKEMDELKEGLKPQAAPAFEDVVDAEEPDITVEVTEESPCEDCEKASCEGCEEAEKKEDAECCCAEEKTEETECCCAEEKTEEAECCCAEDKPEEGECCAEEKKEDGECCCTEEKAEE